MELRPYQRAFCDAVIKDLQDNRTVLGVAATGAGKTIMGSEIIQATKGNCLFLADAKELVWQNADKFKKYTGYDVQVEQANHHASPPAQTVVGTTQSMVRRLNKWPQDYFSLVIVDEAHRNTLGDQAQKVLEYFHTTKVLGLTATPFRSDKKQLGAFYQKLSYDIGLADLIRQGFLSRITIKSVPIGIDLRDIRISMGDYRADDLNAAIMPHLLEAAALLKKHAGTRKTVAFLPLIESSKAFCDACNSIGLRAVHVDGNDRDALSDFTHGNAQVVCNASLLTTGWDYPPLECVYILRPTKSLTLYQQMVGRGTRISPGKQDLLLLDPLYLTDKHRLITPARLVAQSQEEADAIDSITKHGEECDLLDTEEQAEQDRAAKLKEELEKNRRRKARTVDALDFCLSIGAANVAEYVPYSEWEKEPATHKQLAMLRRFGLPATSIKCKGHAGKILDILFARRKDKLATPKQVLWLEKLGHPNPGKLTMERAGEMITNSQNYKGNT